MTQCNGKTRAGKKCRANAAQNGYCRWHQPTVTTNTSPDKDKEPEDPPDCVVCCEPFKPEETALPCGHWVHLECVKKSADALQDIRVREGYPPIQECTCPVCRVPVPGLKPKDPPEVPSLEAETSVILTRDEMNGAFTSWQESDQTAPLSWYLWAILCEKYPNDAHADSLITAASAFEAMIRMGIVNLQPSRPDDRFSRVLERGWR